MGEALEYIPSYNWNTHPSFLLAIWVAGDCCRLCLILEAGASLPNSNAACELLSVLVQITFCTAVGGIVWDKLLPQLSLLIFFENYPCTDLPTGLLKGRALSSKENDGNPSGKCSPIEYEIIEKSSWEFEIPCSNFFISLPKENTTLQRNTKKMILNTGWF